MNEALQRLLPAGLLTLALHGLLLSLQLNSRQPQVELPKPLPMQKICVSLRQPPPPPPPQNKIVSEELPPLPNIEPVELKPLAMLPLLQKKIVTQLPKPLDLKPMQQKPLDPLPPQQNKIVTKQLPSPPDIVQIVRQPLSPLPPEPELKEKSWEETHEEVAVPPQKEVFREERAALSPAHQLARPEQYVQQTNFAPQTQVVSKQSFSPVSNIQEAAPLYQINPPPEYPLQARRRGLEGVVTIEALIDSNGSVADLRLFTSSSHRMLDQAALKAVRSWRFIPGTIGNSRREMWVKVPVRFQLN